ncbi:hypothetical protein PACTADRAFT_50500 [Pachysolen tannophilus NRRL Y-2460]|uniref:DUF1783-domain-containing protein n=1 Tax=Pachysolen tannophilus NRRL Y-2460 TaxID=669874 RepID=A0A1E4TSD1_PACTA|nr:hypothetical protein PACTADRAFT_50500 [Pachysolen tannophilus NRRL Y-2460]
MFLSARLGVNSCVKKNFGFPFSVLITRPSSRLILTRRFLHSEHQPDELIETVSGKRPMTTNHELPDPLRQKGQQRIYFLGFVVAMAISLFGIFNYEKMSSPVMNATMYFLRRSQVARELLGKEISYADLIPWVKGELNTVSGVVDISVRVKGNKNSGLMILKANRSSRSHLFQIVQWSLLVDGEDKIINLLEDNSVEFAL